MLQIGVTIDGKPIRMETRKDKEKFLLWLSTLLEYTADEAPRPRQEVRLTTPRELPQNPPIGGRKIDYAERALLDAGKPLTTRELVPAMVEMGWEPKGADPERAVNVILYQHPEMFTRTPDRKKWVVLGDIARAKAETLAIADDVSQQLFK